MCWLPKVHKTPISARFIVASGNCYAKSLSDTNFTMIFNILGNFRIKNFFYLGCRKFQVLQNSFPVVTKLNKINLKQKAKSISIFDFRTLYTTIPHKLVITVLLEVINFVFKSTSKEAGRRFFIKLLPMLCLFS